ncbi:MAG: cardiolipin synthase ClsB [Desulfobulbaceae bacterium]|nr:cardiolipin synthase ClsB [Desulfobulbaceae bacterium]
MELQFLDGNKLSLLSNGAAFFPALLQAIDAAQVVIFLETYIFANDETGRTVAVALIRAAERGVAVHLLVDGFGSKDMSRRVQQKLLAANVRLLVYNPKISVFALRRQSLRRMHRKLAVIDCRVAFIGGINIIDDMVTSTLLLSRYDYAVCVEGALVVRVQEEVEKLWRRVSWVNFRWHWRQSGVLPVCTVEGNQRAALVVRDNLRHRFDIEHAYFAAIEHAESEIVIANAYFFPGRRFRQALRRAAQRGVRVVLLLQGRMEYVLLHYATRALYGPLLESGVEIYEYHKSFMHAKVAVIDQQWLTVGSSNIDPFSLLLAREANIVVLDKPFAQELRASLYGAMEAGAHRVEKISWYRQPLWQRLLIWSAYGIARLALGLVGHGWTH